MFSLSHTHKYLIIYLLPVKFGHMVYFLQIIYLSIIKVPSGNQVPLRVGLLLSEIKSRMLENGNRCDHICWFRLWSTHRNDDHSK